MDERQLNKIMREMDVPPVDENAKKSALNLALTEFKEARKEKQKNLQGYSFFRRLMGMIKNFNRRLPMSRTMTYGGMAMAMAVLLVIGITIPQFNQYKARSTDQFAKRQIILPPAKAAKTLEPGTSGKPAAVDSREKKNESRRYSGAVPSLEAMVEREAPVLEAALDSLSQTAPPMADEGAMEESDISFVTVPLGKHKSAKAPGQVTHELFSGSYDMSAGFGSAHEVTRGVLADSATRKAEKFASFKPVDKEASVTHYKDVGRDKFETVETNPIKLVSEEPISTFSIDVDTASYSFMRKMLMSGVLPQKDAVRIEEMVNYFGYDYPLPKTKERPFEPTVAVVPSPWKDGNKLIHIGIKGYDIDPGAKQPRSNLVFLLDVSGSMNAPDKLPLMVNSLKLLLDSLQPEDTVGIVVYAGAAGTVLEPTPVKEKSKIINALNRLSAGGSTAGGEGIRQAYQLAEANFDPEAVNRVILATDGDFNVGITDHEELKGFIERKRETGIFLSVFGFGQGNYNDQLMQVLAQNGNGVAAYIDTLSEARKILVDEATSTLFPIARDVKIQIEFNPKTVAEYRLVGYETRHLNREDFNNDAVDAGDIGAGHTVTVIYEITPVGGPRAMDASRYQKTESKKPATDFGNEYAFLKIRYKLPGQAASTLITAPITGQKQEMASALEREIQWATAVAGFGQLLRGGKYTGKLTYDDVIEQAQSAKGKDEFGYRSEFIQLVRMAKSAAAMPH